MLKEEDILYENGRYWVCASQKGGYNGFEVYRNELTHSVRCARIGYEGEKGLERAIAECDKRASEDLK